MARTKQTPRNRPSGFVQQQAAIAFAARNSAANAGIRPLLPLGKMVAGQDSSSSDNEQKEAQHDDRKTNDDEQEEAPDDEQEEETPDDDDKSDENDDDKDDDDENPVDDANEEDDDAAKQTDDDNSAKAVLEIINIDNESNTEAGHADEEAAGILLEIDDSNSESCATLPDGGTTEEAEWKVMTARKILAKLYAKDKKYEAKYKTYMNPTAGMIRPCQVGNKLAAKRNQGELYTKRNEIRK
jgi:hypothetical protein